MFLVGGLPVTPTLGAIIMLANVSTTWRYSQAAAGGGERPKNDDAWRRAILKFWRQGDSVLIVWGGGLWKEPDPETEQGTEDHEQHNKYSSAYV